MRACGPLDAPGVGRVDTSFGERRTINLGPFRT